MPNKLKVKRERTTVSLTPNEVAALRGFFQESKKESLATLVVKALRDGIIVEEAKCILGKGKYARLY